MRGRGVVVKSSMMRVVIRLPHGGKVEHPNTGGFEVGDEVCYYTDTTGKYIRKLLPLEVAQVQEMLGGNETLQTAIREDYHVETDPDISPLPEELVDPLSEELGVNADEWEYIRKYSYSDDQVVRAHCSGDSGEEGGKTSDLPLYFPHGPE